MTKHLKRITPFAIFFVLMIAWILYLAMDSSGFGEAYLTIFIDSLIVTVVIAVADIILRWIFKKNLLYIWITEAVIFIIGIYILIIL